MRPAVMRFITDDHGAAVIEYALLASFIAVGIILILSSIGINLVAIFQGVLAGFT
jgi:Flp pilus assembly pilin Flp